MKELACIVFKEFETLDLFGPVQLFGLLKEDYKINFYSAEGGIILSSQNVPIQTKSFNDFPQENYLILLPGGWGTRAKISDQDFLIKLKPFAQKAVYVLTVCTGSPLLAKTNFLDGKNATTNKLAFNLGPETNSNVNWIRKARWVVDTNIYTSSGVSAGMDMTLQFIADQHGLEIAKKLSNHIEYIWNTNPNEDPFA